MPTPVLGMALGSGGARGFAQLGVLAVLEAAGIRPRALAGASMGALIGALYAAGLGVREIRAYALQREILRSLRPTVPRRGFISAQPFARFLRSALGDTRLEDLPIPLAISALDLQTRRRVILERGPVVPAVLASMAIPGLFEPVRVGGRWLSDPGILDGVPLDVPFALGASYVVVVRCDVAASERRLLPSEPPLCHLFDLGCRLSRLVQRSGLPLPAAAVADALEIMRAGCQTFACPGPTRIIQPDYRGMSANAFHRVDYAMRAGAAAARRALPDIARDLG